MITLSPEGTDLLHEGKTKRIIRTDDPKKVHIVSKDDLTAGDGAKHDVFAGKAALSTTTTCNVFGLLKHHGMPIAFHEQINDITFSAPECVMIPVEVVVRRRAFGSYLKRNPDAKKGDRFDDLLVEFYLKTKDRKLVVTVEGETAKATRPSEFNLPCDDPFMVLRDGQIDLHDPRIPVDQAFLTIPARSIFQMAGLDEMLAQMAMLAKQAFLILEAKIAEFGGTLNDYKVEFGHRKNSWELLLADVIDNDSWRVEWNGEDQSKQSYREGAEESEVMRKYRFVAEITRKF